MRSKIIFLLLVLVAVGGSFAVLPAQVSAMNELGPDPLDLGDSSRTDRDGYIITSTDYDAAVIPKSTVPVYFTTNTGTKTIVITDANLCEDNGNRNTPVNEMDVMRAPNAYNTPAAMFYVENVKTGVKSPTKISVVQGGVDCWKQTVTLTFNGSYLELDTTTGLFVVNFSAETLGISMAENRFRIVVSDSAGLPGTTPIVGYSSSVSAESFGVGHNIPVNALREYKLPFAPDCTVTAANSDATAVLYDLDNGSLQVQGEYWMAVYVEEFAPDGVTSLGRIPLTFTKSNSANDPNGAPATMNPASTPGPNGYEVDTNSKVYVYVHMKLQPDNKYKLGLTKVYNRNILQFKLPFDSIYFNKRVCTTPPVVPPVIPAVPIRPYFEANGGDVVAGASFATSSPTQSIPCAAVTGRVTNAGIAAWNSGATASPSYPGTPAYAGASADYAAYALGIVQNFVTGQKGGVTVAANDASELTFSNDLTTINPALGLFGGMFGGVRQCVDLWTARPAALKALPGPQPEQPASWASDTYNVNGNITIGGGASLPAGKQITLYVKGNVYIKDNIKYSGGTWTDRNQIPYFRLIVNGTIFIDRSVDTLDGLYASIPDNGGWNVANKYDAPIAGTISTCSTGFASYDPTKITTTYPNYKADCSQKLVVTGSVAAQQLWLLRTGGAVTNGAAAEQFVYSPEVWLAPAGGSSTGQSYQSVVGLPPTL